MLVSCSTLVPALPCLALPAHTRQACPARPGPGLSLRDARRPPPLSCPSLQLYFAMTSLWLGYFYYLFGFVLVIGLLTCAINAEISLLCTYVQLCAEDYQWW